MAIVRSHVVTFPPGQTSTNMDSSSLGNLTDVPKRFKRARYTCAFVTAKGKTCPYSAKHSYNGKHLCSIHLNTTKANEDCCICFSPMDDIMKRVKLSCGHYFHTACLGQCEKIECPLCRTGLNTYERCKIYFPTKVAPIFRRVFSMPGEKQKTVMSFLEELVAKVEGMDTADMDVFRAYNSNFFYAMDTIGDSPFINDKPSDVIYDWVDVMRGGVGHLGRYGTYAGMLFNSNMTMLSWQSHNPYHLAPLAPLPPPPPPVDMMMTPPHGIPPVGPRDPRINPHRLPRTPDIYEEEDEYVRERAPSPVLPWYMQG